MSEPPVTGSMTPGQRSDLQKRALCQFGRAEDSLDIAVMALRDIRAFAAMDGQFREEVVGEIQHQLAVLTEIISPM